MFRCTPGQPVGIASMASKCDPQGALLFEGDPLKLGKLEFLSGTCG
jgi:hypothetical protein